MSNYLAIATVTAVLSRNLQATIDSVVSGKKVGTGRPDVPQNATSDVGVNLYLYQVTPNAALHNTDLPTRRPDGSLKQRPRVALDLHYLLSFYGDESKLEPQLLLGSVVRTLHARPVLTRKMIQDTLADPYFSFLAKSNLADSVESVKFTPSSLSLEDISKLWSVFFQTPYALSVAYQGTVVSIESETDPQPALPVRTRNLYTVPFRQPTIERIMSQAAEGEPVLADQPILAGYRLVLVGKELRGEVTRVRIGGVEKEVEKVDDAQVVASLPRNLRAGVQSVQVIQHLELGTPPVPHAGVESNVAAFVLSPKITASVGNIQGSGTAPRSADIEVEFDPKVGKSQRVVLMLNEHRPPSDRPARAYSFAAPSRGRDDPDENSDESSFIQVHVTGVECGTYLVHVQVDGAESPLHFNEATNEYDSPQVTIN